MFVPCVDAMRAHHRPCRMSEPTSAPNPAYHKLVILLHFIVYQKNEHHLTIPVKARKSLAGSRKQWLKG